MTNFTTAHESRARFVGADRLDYPDDHIEVDNRLSWFLGRLDRQYGDEPYYVHLTRDAREVAESYARRMDNPVSIGAAHKKSILVNSPQGEPEICTDVVETMLANTTHFLRDKTKVMRVAVESIDEDFPRFWDWIKAEGDLPAALKEWKTFYNDGRKGHGAISPTIPKTELADLRERYRDLSKKLVHVEQEIIATTERFGKADKRRRELEGELRVAEDQRGALEKCIAAIEGRLAERDDTIAGLRSSMNGFKKRLTGERDKVGKELAAFVRYSDELKEQYAELLNSRTWKVFEPYRFVMRRAKGMLLGNEVRPKTLPTRPSSSNFEKIKRREEKRKAKPVSRVQRLDKRLWGGFSRSALPELCSFRDDPNQEPADRSQAAYCLARWYSVQGLFDQALQEMKRMRLLYPDCADDPRQYLPEALFLCRTGKAEEARALLQSAQDEYDTTAQLLRANTWNPAVTGISGPEAEDKILECLNVIYARAGLTALEKRNRDAALSLDNLRGGELARQRVFDPEGKVSVIVPAYNAEDTIRTALLGLAEQTWQNLEVLIVDDDSTDGTETIVREFCTQDDRFRLIRQTVNGGSYLCRNRALAEATGAFVTVHDSDDWSHPDKIRSQVEYFRNYPGPYNLATWVRTTSALEFFGNSRTLHDLVRPDHSSGLFPRETLQRFGGWDAVRISADTELFWRIECLLGNKKWMLNRRVILAGTPLSFGRMSDTSLTQAAMTSVMTIYHGLRREYRDAAEFWHSRLDKLDDADPARRREPFFPVPIVMDTTSARGAQLSLLLIGDWNSAPDLTDALFRLLPARLEGRVGLLHYPNYKTDVSAPLNKLVRGFAWDRGIRVVAPGEVLRVDTVLVTTPSVFEHLMDRVPEVTHERLFVVGTEAITTPQSACDHQRIRAHLREVFGQEGDWLSTLEECQSLLAEATSTPMSNAETASGAGEDASDYECSCSPDSAVACRQCSIR